MNTDRQNCWQNYAYFSLTEHVQECKQGRADCSLYTMQQRKNPQENPYQPMDLKNLENKIREDYYQIFVISTRKIHTLGYGLKINRKSIAQPMDFFVISISDPDVVSTMITPPDS